MGRFLLKFQPKLSSISITYSDSLARARCKDLGFYEYPGRGKGSVPATKCHAKLEIYIVGGRIILPKWHAYASNSFWQSYASIA
jgi:hypothetical protein